MDKVDIAGVFVNNISKAEALQKISEFASGNYPRLVVTTYSEFVVFAQSDSEYRQVINSANLSLPDGVGILWAAKFLSLPLSKHGLLSVKLRAAWQVVYTGASLIFYPQYCRTIIKEQITGSRLIWDIASLAQDSNLTLALVGGTDNVAVKTANRLKQEFPQLKVNLAVSDQAFDQGMIRRIASSNSDILLIAYSPPRQEKWLAQNLSNLNVKVAMGVGGTFDYIADKRLKVPHFVHYIGLEWLWRLITQPWRIKRIWNAIFVFIRIVYKYKLSKLN